MADTEICDTELPRVSLLSFIRRHGLKLSHVRIKERIDLPEKLRTWGDKHWQCEISRPPREGEEGRQTLQVGFSGGKAIKYPTLGGLLDCIASDSAGLENADNFEDWAAEIGEDPDSRRAELIYETVKAQAKKFRAFLGDEVFEALLWKVDRDA